MNQEQLNEFINRISSGFKMMSARGETVPTVEGLDQVAGSGTKPINLEHDKKLLIEYLNKFNYCEGCFNFSFHPYFGIIQKAQWERLVIHHLNHHLNQFSR